MINARIILVLVTQIIQTWWGFCFLYLRRTRSPQASSFSQSDGGDSIRCSGRFKSV